MKKLTKEQAIKIAKSEIWKDMTNEEIVKFQLFTELLCMPFDRFHEAIEKVLNRPVFTHEFAFEDDLKKEYLKEKQPPTFDEICNLIPKEKRIIILK
jgi:hypothetical protein